MTKQEGREWADYDIYYEEHKANKPVVHRPARFRDTHLWRWLQSLGRHLRKTIVLDDYENHQEYIEAITKKGKK